MLRSRQCSFNALQIEYASCYYDGVLTGALWDPRKDFSGSTDQQMNWINYNKNLSIIYGFYLVLDFSLGAHYYFQAGKAVHAQNR